MKFIFILLLMFFSLNAKEFSFKENYSIQDILNSKEWNQLLYYKDGISEVNDNSFFLNKNGKFNSQEELLSTLESYSTKNISDASSICKYPARYFFLNKFVNFDNYEEVNSKCSKLNKWEFLNTQSISLVLVSGYISNPASTFGHSFIKLNKDNNDLFSSSINYGALVPEDENIVKYIIKGLTGMYQAGFSDKYFYSQDLTYTDTEFRDMWEYKLNLTDYERKLILFHIWEIVGKKYDYFFLNKNCGFRVTEILNLITNKDFLDKNQNWFLPIETFQDLESFESDKISEVKFIPSNKRIFNLYFDNLNQEEKNIVKELILNKFSNLNNFNKIEENNKINVLNFLMLYYKQNITIDPENQEFIYIKRLITLERFKYKVSEKEELEINQISSPAKNTNPINLDLVVGNSSYDKSFLGVSFSPYKQSSLGISNLDYDDLIALEGTIGFNNEHVFVDKFDLINIKKINLEKNNIFDTFIYNWNVHIGLERFNNNLKSFIDMGIGYNFYKENNIIIYSMIDFSINDDNLLSLKPNLNLEYAFDNFKFKFKQEKEFSLFEKEEIDITNFNIQYNINKNSNIGYELKYIESEYKNIFRVKINF